MNFFDILNFTPRKPNNQTPEPIPGHADVEVHCDQTDNASRVLGCFQREGGPS